MGLREANQRFAAAIKAVKAGKDVILTDRGKPVAVIRRLAHSATVEQRARDLEAAGLLQAATRRGPMPRWRPRAIRGAPLARTVEQERETR
jgi:prevent-host-death family protein